MLQIAVGAEAAAHDVGDVKELAGRGEIEHAVDDRVGGSEVYVWVSTMNVVNLVQGMWWRDEGTDTSPGI